MNAKGWSSSPTRPALASRTMPTISIPGASSPRPIASRSPIAERPGKELARHRLVDDGDRGRPQVVREPELAAGDERDAERREVLRPDLVAPDPDGLGLFVGGTRRPDVARLVASGHRGDLGGRDRADPRGGGQRLGEPPHELRRPLGRVAVRLGSEREGEDVVRLDAQVDAAEVGEAPGEETGGHEQDERQGDLRRHEPAARPDRLAPGRARAAALAAQRPSRVEPRRAVRRADAEEDPGDDREDGREADDARVDRDRDLSQVGVRAGRRRGAPRASRSPGRGRARRRRSRRSGTRRRTGGAAAPDWRRSRGGCRTRAGGRRRARRADPRGSNRRSGARGRPSPSARAAACRTPAACWTGRRPRPEARSGARGIPSCGCRPSSSSAEGGPRGAADTSRRVKPRRRRATGRASAVRSAAASSPWDFRGSPGTASSPPSSRAGRRGPRGGRAGRRRRRRARRPRR